MPALALSMPLLLTKVSRKVRDVHARLHDAGRKGLARAVYAMPPLQRHDPRRKVVTFRTHCQEIAHFPDNLATAPADWYLRLQSAETIRRQPSISLNTIQAEQFQASIERYQSGEQFEIPERFLASLSRAKIRRQGLITFSRDNHIFVESALSKPEVLESHGILDTVVHPRCARLAGSHCLLGTPWSAGYYHWLLETLPRLSFVERFPALVSAKLILPHQLGRFQHESLALAGVPASRITALEAPCTEVERLYFPQLPAPTGNPSPHAVAWLRARFLSESASTARATRKLYITRRDAPQRRLLNEDSVVRVLEREGFEVVSLSEMSFADQIRLFSQGHTVVAPHGAGLTNVLFSPPGATVVEFFGSNYINGCYWALANICGHRHAFLTGETTRLDYRISVVELEQLLQRLARR